MLDNDDLTYDSMDGEEDDYDEVPEMDSLEQPTVDGELPCTHLALRAKLLGETIELPQVLLGWCLHTQLGSGFLCLLSAGIWVFLPSCWYLGGLHLSYHCAAHTMQTFCSIPVTKAVTSSDGCCPGVVGAAALAGFLCSGHEPQDGCQRPQEIREAPVAAAFGESLYNPFKGCCGHHVPTPPTSQLSTESCPGYSLPRVVSPALNSSIWAEHRGSPPAKPFPCSVLPFWAFPSSATWVWQPPPPVCCQPCLPSPAAFAPQLSPAGCRWTRGSASATPCGGTTTKESPSAGPSSTAAARATSTASTARRSVSCTVGSAWGQVPSLAQLLAPAGPAASPPCAVGSAVQSWGDSAGPSLGSDSTLLLSTDSRGSAGSKVGGQPKV